MSEKLKKDAKKRQEVVLGKERKKLLMLEELKQDSGPFTNAEEVEKFLLREISEREKQARLKKEVKFVGLSPGVYILRYFNIFILIKNSHF